VSAVGGTLAPRVVDAYGGGERWRAATAVEARISMGGFLLRMKGHPERTLTDMRTYTEIEHPHVRVEPIDAAGNVGILDGHDVRIETPDGRVVAARTDNRRHLPYHGLRLFRWDRLDALYFVAYTQWLYNAFPPLLWRDDVEWRQVDDSILEAQFPTHVPVHSQVGRYYFDADSGLLQRMDYTAVVFGNWAKAVHLVEAHGHTDGVPWPSRRRVYGRKPDGTPRLERSPLMVKLDVHEWRLV
jgi:hypothetical protein